MALYGKIEYWNKRYERDATPCEWTGYGYDLIEPLITPNFLCLTSAPPPAGEIRVHTLHQWLMFHLGPLLHAQNDPSCVIDEHAEFEYCDSREKIKVDFPSKEKARVLNVGCGTSSLSADMLYHGWADIVNVDYSEVVIEKMKEKYGNEFYDNIKSCIHRDTVLRHSLGLKSPDDDASDTPQSTKRSLQMTWECGDITQGIDHPNESFDLIICKKTLDVILCSVGSVASARAMMSECFRLLNNEHGVMIILSSGKPEDRAVFFEKDPWTGVLNIKLPAYHDERKSRERKITEHYVYILYKQISSTK